MNPEFNFLLKIVWLKSLREEKNLAIQLFDCNVPAIIRTNNYNRLTTLTHL